MKVTQLVKGEVYWHLYRTSTFAGGEYITIWGIEPLTFDGVQEDDHVGETFYFSQAVSPYTTDCSRLSWHNVEEELFDSDVSAHNEQVSRNLRILEDFKKALDLNLM